MSQNLFYKGDIGTTLDCNNLVIILEKFYLHKINEENIKLMQ